MRVFLDLKGSVVEETLKRHLESRMKQVQAGAFDVAHRGAAEAVRITKVENAIDLGEYVRGFQVVKVQNGVELRNDAPHAIYVEMGRRPMRPGPPYAPIAAWAQRKLGITDTHRIWAIRNAIHVRGIRPKFIMRRTFRQMQGWFKDEMIRRLRVPLP
ncbi:MAG: hypothetical protein ABL912_01855 [Novosphingobium sp.]